MFLTPESISSFRYHFEKIAAEGLPKVMKSGIKKAKRFETPDEESHSLRRAVERNQNPHQALIKARKTNQPTYGGNTASNIRGVIRAQEKDEREILKERFGQHSRISMSKFYQ